MRINKASTCFAALLCVALLSSGCGERPKSKGAKPENHTIPLSQNVSIELVKLPRPSKPIAAHSAEWFGKYEVTQSQWEAIMGNNPSEFKAPNNPVECVSWDDCQEFLKKLNALSAVKQTGLTFRLPTEEEWEYACRAGATSDFCCLADGTEITMDTLGQVAWFKDNADGKPHPVGQKKPNAFGLYDMHGNVVEWTVTADGEDRIARGGSWNLTSEDCEFSVLDSGPPASLFNCLGFRLCASHCLTIPISQTVSIEIVKLLNRSEVDTSSNAIWFGKYEVTQSQWEAIMGNNPSVFKAPNNPVECVSWDDCQEFLKKLNALPAVKQSGLTFRLPTENEWEYACRAGTTGKYCELVDGTIITEKTLDEVAWFDENSDEKTHPVGQKKPNAFGLYDMHGNVGEWCQEELGQVNPSAKGKDFEHERVFRGGDWFFSAMNCESSNFKWESLSHSARIPTLGFRLCADGDQ